MNISEAAKKFELTTDTLRYYEREGLIPFVKRTSGGIRDYGEDDCRRIEFIKCMRSAGMPVDRLAEYMKLLNGGEKTAAERKDMLIAQREILTEKLNELNAALNKLNKKIESYESMLLPVENSLKEEKQEKNTQDRFA